MRFSEWARSTFITQEVAKVGQWRARNSKLPVKNGHYDPSSPDASHQEVPFAEVAMDEACFSMQIA